MKLTAALQEMIDRRNPDNELIITTSPVEARRTGHDSAIAFRLENGALTTRTYNYETGELTTVHGGARFTQRMLESEDWVVLDTKPDLERRARTNMVHAILRKQLRAALNNTPPHELQTAAEAVVDALEEHDKE